MEKLIGKQPSLIVGELLRPSIPSRIYAYVSFSSLQCLLLRFGKKWTDQAHERLCLTVKAASYGHIRTPNAQSRATTVRSFAISYPCFLTEGLYTYLPRTLPALLLLSASSEHRLAYAKPAKVLLPLNPGFPCKNIFLKRYMEASFQWGYESPKIGYICIYPTCL